MNATEPDQDGAIHRQRGQRTMFYDYEIPADREPDSFAFRVEET